MTNIGFYLFDLVRRFKSEDEGLALTEYLILLGLITAAVVAAVLAFGGELQRVWEAWVAFMESLTAPDPISSS